jgi:hypothetical protein
MRSVLLALLGLLLPCSGAADGERVHRMVDEKGKLDMAACSVCHDDALQLSLPKDETCTLCHSASVHAGSASHLNAKPAQVARLLATRREGAAAIPLTDDGRMYCGSCHLFHDPAVAGEKWLAEGWLPPSSGLALAVRQSLSERFESLAGAHGQTAPLAKFATSGTRALRLPVADGRLCLRCHAGFGGAKR